MLYCFYGDQALVDLELRKKKEACQKEGYQIRSYDLALKEEEEFFQALSMNSMFAEKKAFFLKRGERFKAKALQSFLKSIALYDLSEKEVVLAYAGDLTKGTLKELDKLGAKLENFQAESQSKALELFLEKKLQINNYDAKKLLEMLGHDYHKLEAECNKVLAFLDGETFQFDKVLPLLSVEKEYNIFHYVDHFLEQENPAPLLDYLQQNPKDASLLLYQLGEASVMLAKLAHEIDRDIINPRASYTQFKQEYPKLQKHFRGKGGREMHPYPVYLKLKVAKNHDTDFWLQKTEELLSCEYSFKSGFMDMDLAVSKLILGFFPSASSTPQDRQRAYHTGRR